MVEFKEIIDSYIEKLKQAKKMHCGKGFYCFLFDLKKNMRRIKMNIDTKCLVLAQYPGAETKGLGGLIAQYPKNFEVLSFTNGSSIVRGADAIDSAALTKQRFNGVMKEARVKGYKIFNIEDSTLNANFNIIKKIDISEADYIFVPNVYDTNPDTLALLKHFKKLLEIKEYKKNLKIFMYESDFSLSAINFFVDISSIIETKRKMLETYYPKEKDVDYTSKVLGLNMFRALNNNCNYSEAFLSLSVEEFCSIPVI